MARTRKHKWTLWYAALRKERVRKMKAYLFSKLGRKCSNCHSKKDLEIDHVDGRTWHPREVGYATRWRRYVAEYEAGIPLRVLCAQCNGKLGGMLGRAIQGFNHTDPCPF